MMRKSIKVGDRVSFIRADGTLDGEVTVHDVFGDDDTPANISFLSGNVEQTYHSDLVHKVDDVSPVKVPEPETWFLCVGNAGYWGRSKSEKQAVANMRRGGGKPTEWITYRVNQWTKVNDMGGLTWPNNYGEPVEVMRKKKKAA